MIDTPEQWRTVLRDFRYQVSDRGRVRSYARGVDYVILKPGIASNGYNTVTIAGKTVCVHVLVAEAFLGPKPFEGAEVLHDSLDRTDCKAGSLRWGSRGRNIQDNKWQGDGVKLNVEQVVAIKARIANGDRRAEIAATFNVSLSLIDKIATHKVHTDV